MRRFNQLLVLVGVVGNFVTSLMHEGRKVRDSSSRKYPYSLETRGEEGRIKKEEDVRIGECGRKIELMSHRRFRIGNQKPGMLGCCMAIVAFLHFDGREKM